MSPVRGGPDSRRSYRWTTTTPTISTQSRPSSRSTGYYARVNDRGWHPNSIGAFTHDSYMAHVNFGRLRNLSDFAPRRALIITDSAAHSKWFSDIVAEEIGDGAEEIVVKGARHIDLCDRTDLISFDALAAFFTQALGD
jgi:membrane protein